VVQALSAMYLIFRLLDNIIFLAIIVLSIWNSKLTNPTPEQLSLFSAIGLEIFYDIMLQTNKYWFLHRLSIYIAIVLYGIYTYVIIINYSGEDLQLIARILGARFIAFFFEECVDIAIDGELHNDLLRLQKEKPKLASSTSTDVISSFGVGASESALNGDTSVAFISGKEKTWFDKTWLGEKLAINLVLPANMEYYGSFFAWSPASVLTEEEGIWETENNFPRWVQILLCFFPALLTTCLAFILLLVCAVAAVIPVLIVWTILVLAYCTCSGKKIKENLKNSVKLQNFWAELKNF